MPPPEKTPRESLLESIREVGGTPGLQKVLVYPITLKMYNLQTGIYVSVKQIIR